MTLQQFHDSSFCQQENESMTTNHYTFYANSSSHSKSSMENMFSHMGYSLYVCPRNHVVTSQNISCSLEDNYNSEVIATAAAAGDGNEENSNVDVAVEDVVRKRINISEENPNENSVFVKEMNGMQKKVCSRGHWRPAEDSKLRELVALYGPQNWNLIAEKLQGRSGEKFITLSVKLIFICFFWGGGYYKLILLVLKVRVVG